MCAANVQAGNDQKIVLWDICWINGHLAKVILTWLEGEDKPNCRILFYK